MSFVSLETAGAWDFVEQNRRRGGHSEHGRAHNIGERYHDQAQSKILLFPPVANSPRKRNAAGFRAKPRVRASTRHHRTGGDQQLAPSCLAPPASTPRKREGARTSCFPFPRFLGHATAVSAPTLWCRWRPPLVRYPAKRGGNLRFFSRRAAMVSLGFAFALAFACARLHARQYLVVAARYEEIKKRWIPTLARGRRT